MSYIQLLCTVPTQFNCYDLTDINLSRKTLRQIAEVKTAVHYDERHHTGEREIFIDTGKSEFLDCFNECGDWCISSISSGIIMMRPYHREDMMDIVTLYCEVLDGYLRLKDYMLAAPSEQRVNEYVLVDAVFAPIKAQDYRTRVVHNEIWEELSNYLSCSLSLGTVVTRYTTDWRNYIHFRERELDKIEGNYFECIVTQFNDNQDTLSLKVLHNEHPQNMSKYDSEICKDYNFHSKDVTTLSLKEGKKSVYVFDIEKKAPGFAPQKGEKFFLRRKDVGARIMIERLSKNLCSLTQCQDIISIRVAQWLMDVKNCNTYPEPINERFEFYRKSLNEEQKKAVFQILDTDDVSFILGPPGTGKTSVISEAIYQLTKNHKTVLLSSQSNDAIDNALDRLPKNIDIRPVRLGLGVKKDNPFYQDKMAWNMVEQLTKEVERRNEKSVGWVRSQYDRYCLFEAYEKEYEGSRSENYYAIRKEIEDRYNPNRDGKFFTHYQFPTLGQAAYELNGAISCDRKDNMKPAFYDKLENIKRQKSIQKIFRRIIDFCGRCDNEQDDLQAFLQEDNNQFRKDLFDTCNVFGITCNADNARLTRDFMSKSMIYDYALIDEVSKATLPEILGCLLKARHVVLIGDHRQLPPVFQADLDDIDEYTPEQLYGFKMLVTNTIFKKLYTYAGQKIKCMLKKQYRMHNEIANVAISQFYKDANGCSLLQNGLSDEQSDAIKEHTVQIRAKDGRCLVSPAHHIYWIDSTPHMDDADLYEGHEPGNTSIFNDYEVKIIASLLSKIDATAAPGTSVGVISFYSLQNRKLQAQIQPMKLTNINVSVNTVDKFQGQERNIIIVSLVRSKPGRIPKNNSFFKAFERINVAFSRAQNLLFIVGSVVFCKEQVVTIPSISEESSEPIYVDSDVYNSIIKRIDDIGCLIDGQLITEEEEHENSV